MLRHLEVFFSRSFPFIIQQTTLPIEQRFLLQSGSGRASMEHSIDHGGHPIQQVRTSFQTLIHAISNCSSHYFIISRRIFAFVAKRSPTSADNQCHVFCELEITQPASAIVSFANKVVLGGSGGQQPAPTRAI